LHQNAEPKEKPMSNKKKTQTFEDFEKSSTNDYPPPTQLVKPAKGDKGYAMFKKAFDDQKSYYTPGIKSTNKDLDENDY
jgi:hypothetical protein